MTYSMIDEVIKQTKAYLSSMPKTIRKKKGQFFTSKATAEFMAGLFNLDMLDSDVDILDPGAGTGILTAAVIDRIDSDYRFKCVRITCYETDETILEILRTNLEYLKENSRIKVIYRIITEDYLLSQSDDFESTLFSHKKPKKYDIVIGNPPYLRVLKDNSAAIAMPSVVHGAPNLYFLFASMSLFNLKCNHEMVYIIPRSWTSGAYFKAFREYFLGNGKLEHIHLFVSRDSVFDQEEVLQETMIVKVQKTHNAPKYVTLTSTRSCNDFDERTEIRIKYSDIVTGKDLYVFLPTNEREISVIRNINKYSKTFPEEGIRMRTGIIVDFRQKEELRKAPDENTVPLFYSQHIKDGRVLHQASGKEYDWVTIERPGLVQANKNYVFCKRFTAKEEKRRLQCGVYLSEDYTEYTKIGTQNKINYVDDVDGNPLTKEEVYGIYALLNSTLFDMYYRIMNGSTQVNSTEINSIPVPPRDVIKAIGKKLMSRNDMSTATCDALIEGVY